MSERLQRLNPFRDTLTKPAALDVQPLPDCTIVQLKARKNHAVSFGRIIRTRSGIDLPDRPLAAAEGDGLILCAMAPEEFWAIGQAAGHQKHVGNLSPMSEDTFSSFDQSHGFSVLRISGHSAYDILAKGSTLDTRARTFPALSASRTIIQRAPSFVVKMDDRPTFLIGVARSYAEFFSDWLTGMLGRLGRP